MLRNLGIRKRKEESIRAFPEKHEGREYAVFFRSQDFQSEISGLCGNGSHPFGRRTGCMATAR